ncbi:MAG: hypothetical protein M1826_000901 [Phylliscum demangeonii]|nr:MAG: hypothetical protein M1826_000901 [Phylliscum demangeonii]
MPLRIPSLPYTTIQEGFWHPVTSTLNWCEEDYYATIYSAEIVNTLTNLPFMYLAYKGLRNCLNYGHDDVFLVSFVGCFLVAVGSFLFHSTLKCMWRLVDELSMIYTTCLMCYATFSHQRSVTFRSLLAVSLASLAIFITGYYHHLQDPSFHQTAYALLTAVVVFRSIFLMEYYLRPRRRHAATSPGLTSNGSVGPIRLPFDWTATERRDKAILHSMWMMVAYGLICFLGGFVIWTLDNHFCTTLRAWRRRIGLPWGIVLEGHGWWHLMTGIGAYCYVVWGIWLRHCLNGRHDEYRLEWPSMFYSLPQIVTSDAHSASNGVVKAA